MPPILIIDCDKIRKYHAIPMEKKLFNLAQFIACSPSKIDSNLQLYPNAMKAFFDGYAQEGKLTRGALDNMVGDAVACALGNRKIEVRMPPEMLKGLSASMMK